MEDLKSTIVEQITKMENIPAENVEILDVFYYSGLKKWAVSVAFNVNGKHYVASMDILENGLVARYQQREKNEN
ncbi:hypothetical protein FAD_1311 [Ferroplasma acidiphilum]|uniref:Uncharacterized protein n=2 Tax=Ferroplasma acidiphilum TaxID=74969 RepID=A0A1V0N4Z0_9ARCH|nr:hypothetical protein FAD_1311 [Ferroplasma acidiphilum]